MKVAIVGGAGAVGSTTAFFLGESNLVEEICLIDHRANVAKSHQMDMEQALCTVSKTKITSGGWEQLQGADLIVLAVGKVKEDQAVAPKRLASLQDNLAILSEVALHIREYAPEAILLNATNPVDVLNVKLQRMVGTPSQKIIGFSLNDTYRFRWAISKVLDVDAAEVKAMVVGEHGDSQVPLCSQVTIGKERVVLHPAQKEEVLNITRQWFREHAALRSGRSSGWLSGKNIASIIGTMIEETKEIIPCSVIDEDGISLGRPVRLSRHGVESLVPFEMDEEERAGWLEAREKVVGILDGL